MTFGKYIRDRRQTLAGQVEGMSLRKVALSIGVEPAYLSRVERDLTPPPSELKIVALADVLGVDPDMLLAMAGKISSDLQKIILNRPELFGQLLRKLKEQPDHAILYLVREVSDGNW